MRLSLQLEYVGSMKQMGLEKPFERAFYEDAIHSDLI